MKKLLIGLLALAGLGCSAFAAFDTATNIVYGTEWTSGQNGGDGFDAWTLTPGANPGDAGGFIVSNTTSALWGYRAWAINATTGTFSAVRPISGMALPVGETFNVSFKNSGFTGAGKQVGIQWLETDQTTARLKVFCDATLIYIVDGNGTNSTKLARQTGVVYLALKLTDANTYELKIISASGNLGLNTFTGPLAGTADAGIENIGFYNTQTGAGDLAFFINDLKINIPSAISEPLNFRVVTNIDRMVKTAWAKPATNANLIGYQYKYTYSGQTLLLSYVPFPLTMSQMTNTLSGIPANTAVDVTLRSFNKDGVESAETAPLSFTTGSGENLIVNPGFEIASVTPTSAPAYWSGQFRDTNVFRTGEASDRVQVANNYVRGSEFGMYMRNGQNYELSGWIKTLATPTKGGTIGILFSTMVNTPYVTGTSDWTYVSLIFSNTFPSGIYTMRLTASTPTANEPVYYDDLSLVEVGAVASTPVITPGDGTRFVPTLNVAISNKTDGATVWYTLDGSSPAVSPTRIMGTGVVTTVVISNSLTVKAYAHLEGAHDSSIAQASYVRVVDYIQNADFSQISDTNNGTLAIWGCRPPLWMQDTNTTAGGAVASLLVTAGPPNTDGIPYTGQPATLSKDNAYLLKGWVKINAATNTQALITLIGGTVNSVPYTTLGLKGQEFGNPTEWSYQESMFTWTHATETKQIRLAFNGSTNRPGEQAWFDLPSLTWVGSVVNTDGNLIKNPGFEITSGALTNTPDAWQNRLGLSRDVVEKHSGNGSMRVETLDALTPAYTMLANLPTYKYSTNNPAAPSLALGETYTLSGWIKMVVPSDPALGAGISVRTTVPGVGSVILGEANITGDNNDAWRYVEVVFTNTVVNGTAVEVRASWSPLNYGDTVWFDDLSLKQGSGPGPQPGNPDIHVTSIARQAGQQVVNFNGVSNGWNYVVEASTNLLVPGSFTTVGTPVLTPPTGSYTDPVAAPKKAYRIKATN